jgi:hypothetical protein
LFRVFPWFSSSRKAVRSFFCFCFCFSTIVLQFEISDSQQVVAIRSIRRRPYQSQTATETFPVMIAHTTDPLRIPPSNCFIGLPLFHPLRPRLGFANPASFVLSRSPSHELPTPGLRSMNGQCPRRSLWLAVSLSGFLVLQLPCDLPGCLSNCHCASGGGLLRNMYIHTT